MTVTFGKEGADRQPATATGADEQGSDPQLARARDGQDNPFLDRLPDAESVRRAASDLVEEVEAFLRRVGSGSIWDIQPPSPRELVDRVLDGPWNTSGEPLLVGLARIGMVATLVWSVPLYTLAVLSQRFGRAIWAVTITVLFFYWL